MNLKLAIAGVLLSIGLASPALAYPGGGPGPFGHRHAAWELIGTQMVSFRTERDTIFVRGRDRHRQIMICAYRQPVRLFDVDVRFANGGRQDVAVRNVLQPGQCTRAIDLRGNRRDLRSVSFTYRTAPGFHPVARFGRGAVIRVYAR
jgi:hypothetical protein